MTLKRQAIDPYFNDGRPTVRGFDVSSWQDDDGDRRTLDVDFAAAAASGESFVIIRQGDGDELDGTFLDGVPAALDAGLLVGGYHYARAYHGAELVAGWIVDACIDAGLLVDEAGIWQRGALPFFIDAEGTPQKSDGSVPKSKLGIFYTPDGKGVDPLVVIEFLGRLVELLEARGVPVGIYSGVTWHFSIAPRLDEEGLAFFGRLPFWLPSYSKAPRMPIRLEDGKVVGAPWNEVDFWQWTGSGVVAGVPTKCDRNLFRGTLEELRCTTGLASSAVIDALLEDRVAELEAELDACRKSSSAKLPRGLKAKAKKLRRLVDSSKPRSPKAKELVEVAASVLDLLESAG